MTKAIANTRADIDPEYSDHLPVHCRCPGDLTNLRFIRKKPDSNGYEGTD